MSKPRRLKVVVFCYQDMFGHYLLKKLESAEFEVVGIVFSNTLVKGMSKNASIWHMAKGMPLRWLFYGLILTDIGWGLRRLLMPLKILRSPNIPVKKTLDVNSPDLQVWLRSLSPDFIASSHFNLILNEETISIPAIGAINVHAAPLPRYRGPEPGFWILNNGEPTTGVTLHIISPGIDEGQILDQEEIAVPKGSSLLRLDATAWFLSVDMIIQFLNNFRSKELSGIEQIEHSSTYYSWPTKSDLIDFKRKGLKLFDLKSFIYSVRYR